MTKDNNRLASYLPVFILAITAAVGWYFYYVEVNESQEMSAESRSELGALNNKLMTLQSRIDKQQGDKDSMQDRLESENKALQEEIDFLNGNKTKLLFLLDEEKDLRLGLTKELEQARVEKKSAETELANHRTSKKALREEVDSLNEDRANLKLLLEGEKDARQTLGNELDRLSVEKELAEAKLQQQVNSVKLTTAELEAELEKRQAEQKSLRNKMISVSGEKSKLIIQLEQEQASNRNIANLKNRLEQELNESRVVISQLKNHMTIIKLTSEVLFGSGSAQIKPDGQKVLSIIADSLNAYPDRAISVEGHTDNIPIRNAKYQSNWELSVARSLAAVNFFQLNNQVNPKRLRVIGYGEYHPVAGNEIAADRKLNRRIEIKLLPPEIVD